MLAGDSFTLLSTSNATGLSGAFTGLTNGARLTTLDGAGSFQINYQANALIISSFQPLAVPEPSTYVLIATGAVMVCVGARRRRKL